MTKASALLHCISILAVITFMAFLAWADPVPTTIDDFFLPGSQPDQSGTFQSPNQCDNCHGDYDPAAEPAFNWRGSMMSQAMRDPLFLATMSIANQDAPESGDLCIRCHTPVGWLEGRSIPTNGSALTADDREGVQCMFCHRMVKPTALGVNPYPNDPDYTAGTYPFDQIYLANLDPIPGWAANGMYICDSDNVKRGPYVDAEATHQMYYSPFHRDIDFCGTCHNVSNPAFTRDPGGAYVPNAFGAPAPDFDPVSMFPVERTYSEWVMSDYNTPGGVYAPQFGGNLDYVSTCQDCHMKDVTGKGCDKNWAMERTDLGLHDQTGGNIWVPNLIEDVYPGEADLDALAAGIERATYLLQNAATMELAVEPSGSDYRVDVSITNETGHKLPSGYPEGRRIWINVKVYDVLGSIIYESGAYDAATGILTDDPDLKVYEIKPGISEALAPVVNLPAGPSFHFVLNDTIYKDNRVPPRGFTNANFELIQSPPVAYSYDDGQYWDETEYVIPGDAAEVEVTLYYQTTSKEYVEFLRDENVTDDWGTIMYDLWVTYDMCPPVAMVTDTYTISAPPPPPAMMVEVTYVSGSPIPAGGGDLVYDIWGENQEPDPMDWDGWIDMIYLPGTPSADTTTVISREMTNYQPGWQINRPGVFYPVPGDWPGGDYELRIYSGWYPEYEVWQTDAFSWVKEGSLDLDFDFEAHLPAAGFPDPFDLAELTQNNMTTPAKFVMIDAYPNPFNPSTTIRFNLPKAAHVKLAVFDLQGRVVADLIRDWRNAGIHEVTFDGSNLVSGVYLCHTEAGGYKAVKKIVLMK